MDNHRSRPASFRARNLEDVLTLEEEVRLGNFTTTGYPMSEAGWLADLETKSARRLTPPRRGRPCKGRG